MILHNLPTHNYNKYIIIDTETTGLSEKDVILQLSWLVLDEHLHLTHTRDYIIKVSPDIVITNSFIHGITQELSQSKGQDLSLVLYHLEKDILEHDCLIIGHNIKFDIKFIVRSCKNPNNNKLKDYLIKMDWFDTMVYSTDIVCIPNRWNTGHKYPKLIQLYEFLFNQSPQLELHNSLNDVKITKDCFVRLMRSLTLEG